ncbi:hypothetical protein SBBP1_90002 [Burkholderiales bacterium]|nr:hypothetical protein SBBP1_90002 [Burkholderiales bacterium]
MKIPDGFLGGESQPVRAALFAAVSGVWVNRVKAEYRTPLTDKQRKALGDIAAALGAARDALQRLRSPEIPDRVRDDLHDAYESVAGDAVTWHSAEVAQFLTIAAPTIARFAESGERRGRGEHDQPALAEAVGPMRVALAQVAAKKSQKWQVKTAKEALAYRHIAVSEASLHRALFPKR